MTTRAGRRFIYLLGNGLPATVVHSQVFTVLRRLAERGVVFDVFVNQPLAARSQRAELSRRVTEARRLVPGRVHVWTWPGPDFLVKRASESGGAVGRARTSTLGERSLAVLRRVALEVQGLLTQIGILAFMGGAIWRREVIVVHSRGAALDVGIGLKRWYSGFRVLTDVRGDAPAEYLYDVAKQGRPANDPLVRREHRWLRRRERKVLLASDAVQCVSHALRRRLAQEYGLNETAIRVVPGLADEQIFFYEAGAREAVRRGLALAREILFVYSGSLAAWQVPEVLLRVWNQVSARLAGARLLLLTPEAERAWRLIGDAGFSPGAEPLVRSARHEDVRAYLSAADVGLLLREPHPLNQVASPTKLAEYLLCGLSVLVSRGVGDSAEIVEVNGLGTVLDSYDDLQELERKLGQVLEMSRDGRRAERARRAAAALGLSARINALAEFYREL